MMEEKIENMLKEEEHPENIRDLLEDINNWLRYSRGKMSTRYDAWDHNMEIFGQKRDVDESDRRAAKSDEPEKMIVPMGYTQVMTFTTFCFMLYKQNNTFFDLNPTGNEDFVVSETANKILERDLRKNVFGEKLFQILLDVARFGLSITKTTWKQEFQWVNVQSEPEVSLFQMDMAVVDEILPQSGQDVLKYEGNRIDVVSPYRFFPDMRLPLTRWKEGRFTADEQEYNKSYLKELESEGVIVGTKYIEKFSKQLFEQSRRVNNLYKNTVATFDSTKSSSDENDFMCVSTEGCFRINGKKYGLSDDDRYENYIITIVNDTRIVRIEKAGYLHGESIYDLTQFLPDEHASLNMALSDTVDALQSVVTWLINSRIISLRQGLDRHLVVNPQFIDTTGLSQKSPIILTRKGAPAAAVSNFVQQIQYKDGSGQNIQEADVFMKIMQTVTGVNENAMGQYSPGRRSATENRAANAGAASRMTMHAMLIWEQLLAPMGQKMLTNLRQGLSFESFEKILGKTSPTPDITIDQLYQLFCPGAIELVGSEDFFIFDSTSKTEKQYVAVALQELVGILSSNPQLLMMTQYDLTKLIDEINYLRGVNNVARLKRTTPAVDPNSIMGQQVLNGGTPVGPEGTGGLSEVPAL